MFRDSNKTATGTNRTRKPATPGFYVLPADGRKPLPAPHKKTKQIIEPLFPRYLFLNAIATTQNLAPVRSTRGVISMVRFGTDLAVIPDSIINAIKTRIEPSTGLIKIKPLQIKAGDKVKIFDGPLAGINGIVTERNSKTRALILMDLMGHPTSVEVDALNLQRTG